MLHMLVILLLTSILWESHNGKLMDFFSGIPSLFHIDFLDVLHDHLKQKEQIRVPYSTFSALCITPEIAFHRDPHSWLLKSLKSLSSPSGSTVSGTSEPLNGGWACGLVGIRGLGFESLYPLFLWDYFNWKYIWTNHWFSGDVWVSFPGRKKPFITITFTREWQESEPPGSKSPTNH